MQMGCSPAEGCIFSDSITQDMFTHGLIRETGLEAEKKIKNISNIEMAESEMVHLISL